VEYDFMGQWAEGQLVELCEGAVDEVVVGSTVNEKI